MNLTPKKDIHEFNQFLFEEIDLDLYKYKFLNDYVSKATQGLMPLYDSSIINTSQNGWIAILHGDVLLIYGENWDENQISEISVIFDLNKFTNFSLWGEDDLIDKLIKFYKPKNFETEKRRILYCTDEINSFSAEGLKIQPGSLDRMNELAVMLQQYYHEEYHGLNEKTIEEMEQRIVSVIQAEKIYMLLDENENLLSFCTIIDPDIGIMFTKKEHRNKGYGKIILSYCSNLLYHMNKIVYVMTDRDQPESNVVCEAVGFKSYYYYSMKKINYG